MAERHRKVKWLRSRGNPAWEKRSRSAVALASLAPAAKPGRGPCRAVSAPSPSCAAPPRLPGECGPDRLPGLTWPGMEKAEPQRFGEGGTIRTLARPRPEIRAPWGKSWVPRGGFARTPKVLGAFGGR